ncbi:MAG: sigma-54 dependent transcriptional regulator [Desulfobacterales bacterium]
MNTVLPESPLMVVDDDPGLLLSVKTMLVSAGLPEPVVIADSTRAMETVRGGTFRLILLDLNMPRLGGMPLLKQIKSEFPDIECIIVTATDDVPTAIEAMRYGAYDYLVKPLNSEKLIVTVQHALERFSLKHQLQVLKTSQSFSQLHHPNAFRFMVAEDAKMASVFRQVEMVAPTDYSVVVNGESGTGKELLANIIHNISSRRDGPFIAVNMAAASSTLFEDEFFGHAKGAYTDAKSDRRGFFEAAQGGTLFLDEITELALPLQGKLLRVIEERELYRLGSTEVRDVDVRIIAATNQEIQGQIESGLFRADLFYRLNMYNIRIPPLRERTKDILPLARYFLLRHARRNEKAIHEIDESLQTALLNYAFPGNVRELENIIASAVLLETSSRLRLASAVNLTAVRGAIPPNGAQEFQTLAQLEKEHIRRVLRAVNGKRARAVEILGVNTTTVYRKIEKYRLNDEP